jgi:dimethylargininase
VLTALTRGVSSRINECELSHIERQPIDFNRAIEQHQNYQHLRRSLGVSVTEIPAQDDCPDCCFIEDTSLVLDELAVVTRPGSETRRREVEGVLPCIGKYRHEIVTIESRATLEGGDVLRVGRNLFVGLTERTNREGIQSLRGFVAPHGYVVQAVDVRGALHLKSVCTAVNERTILAESSRLDLRPFKGFDIIEVPPEEWMAANILLINRTVCMHSGFGQTQRLLQRRGFNVRTVDISEFLKAEAGLTCMSLILTSPVLELDDKGKKARVIRR